MRNSFYIYAINPEKNVQSKKPLNSQDDHRIGLFTRFTQALIKGGKKGKAEIIFHQTLKKFKQKGMKDVDVFTTLENAVNNARPSLYTKQLRVSGSMHFIPFALEPKKKACIAIHWLIKGATERRHKVAQKGRLFDFSDFLSAELSDAARGSGIAVQMRDNVHKLVESNRVSVSQKY